MRPIFNYQFNFSDNKISDMLIIFIVYSLFISFVSSKDKFIMQTSQLQDSALI